MLRAYTTKDTYCSYSISLLKIIQHILFFCINVRGMYVYIDKKRYQFSPEGPV